MSVLRADTSGVIIAELGTLWVAAFGLSLAVAPVATMSLSSRSVPPMDIGDLAETYSVVRELGRGGMGTVVVARHRGTFYQVAIKIATPEKLDPDALARLTREGRLMARLHHPNIVRLYEVRPIGGGRIGIVMEYVKGTSLSQLLARRRPLPVAQCKSILRDLAKALAHAHEGGVVHRDVKPANVLLEAETGTAKLSDFGIAKGTGDSVEVTAVGGVVGTPAYMSPEQVDGLELDGRSDLYSLGVLGWQLFSGQQPWEGEPLFRLLFKQKHENLPSLAGLRPDTPRGVLLALEGAMAKDPAFRWSRAEDMLAQLDSDDPLPALLERRRVVAAVPTGDRSLVDQATVPIWRRPRAPHRREDSGEPVADAQTPEPPSAAAPAVETSASPPPAPARLPWWRTREFGLGAGAGGLLVLMALQLLSLADDRSPATSLTATPADAASRLPPTSVNTSSLVPTVPFTSAALASRRPVADTTAPPLDLTSRARVMVYSGNAAAAAPLVDSALALNTRDAAAYILRARLRVAQGTVREAWTDIELGARTGARWEALALGTMLRVRELDGPTARQLIEKELHEALTPRREIAAERAVALAAAVVQTGDTSTALTLLEYAAPDARLRLWLTDPLLDRIRASNRFQQVVRRHAPPDRTANRGP